MKYKELFSPLKIRGLELKNRIVLPAMMTKMVSPRSGEVTQTLIDYHVAKVKGGCGLNITEVCAIDDTTNGIGYMALYEPYHQIGFKRLVDAVHEEAGKICAQIWHGGTVVQALLPKEQKPMLTNDMSLEDIDYIISRFKNSTKMAVEAGVDAIEFHCGHAYLAHTFLSAGFNHRNDHYGGSFENRMRFPLEVIRAMREVMPEDMPLLMRLDCFDDLAENAMTIDDTIEFLKVAEANGVDVADISRGNNSSGLIYEVPSIETSRGYNIENFSKIKKETNMLVIGVGRINTPKLANDIIKENHADLVAIGRAQIADSEFANKAMKGQDDKIRKCVACNTGCFDLIMNPNYPTITCMRNPFVGKEGMKLPKTKDPKKVLVVGAGLAGLTAASLLKEIGHNPLVHEKSSRVGGQFVLAGKAPGLAEMEEAAIWEGEYLKDLGVDVQFNSTIGPSEIEEIKPDSVIFATGASPFIPNIPGVNGENVYVYSDILDGLKLPKGKTIVIGGGATGIETAVYLAHKGNDVTIIEQLRKVGSTLGWVRLINSMTQINQLGIETIVNGKCESIGQKSVSYSQNGQVKELACDNVIIAVGPKSNPIDDLIEKCKEANIPYHIAGDANSPRLAMNASEEGMAAAMLV